MRGRERFPLSHTKEAKNQGIITGGKYTKHSSQLISSFSRHFLLTPNSMNMFIEFKVKVKHIYYKKVISITIHKHLVASTYSSDE